MELLTLPDVAEALGVPVTRVHQYVRDGHLVASATRRASGASRPLLVQDGADRQVRCRR